MKGHDEHARPDLFYRLRHRDHLMRRLLNAKTPEPSHFTRAGERSQAVALIVRSISYGRGEASVESPGDTPPEIASISFAGSGRPPGGCDSGGTFVPAAKSPCAGRSMIGCADAATP